MRSLIGLIRTSAHLYLSFLRNVSAKDRAKGWTGPAPISRIVTLCFFMSGRSKNECIRSCYFATKSSIHSKSSLMFMFGLSGFPHFRHLGMFIASPVILLRIKLKFSATSYWSKLHLLHCQSSRLPFA